MKRRRILITGTSGRLGSALTNALASNHDIVQLTLEAPRDPAQCAIGRLIVGSILDPGAVAQAMDDVDVVIHNAGCPGSAPPHFRAIETNVLGTFHMLEEAGNRAEVEQFIYISSVQYHGIFGQATDNRMPAFLPIDEQHPSLAVHPYACSKVQAEYWCQNYVDRFHKPVVVIRPTWIVPLELEAKLKATPATPRPGLHDYVAISDLVRGIAQCLDYHPADGIDRFLFSADDQRSLTPSLELGKTLFPGVPLDVDKLAACDGFGSLVCSGHAAEVLRWRPVIRCRRPTP